VVGLKLKLKLVPMSDPHNDTATNLLLDSTRGNARAADALFPLVYSQLRSMADSLFRHNHSPRTLDPTELVHEAYLKLVRHDAVGKLERTHFFRLAARAMRQVLCDHAAAQRAAKRGGDWARVDLTIADPASPERLIDALEMDDALETLRQLDERKAEVVTLRFLGGMSIAETAEALDVSVRTVELDWRFARAWLRKRLTGESKS
jgi:RNA polymerase sigma factor (TIGR02999 family)